ERALLSDRLLRDPLPRRGLRAAAAPEDDGAQRAPLLGLAAARLQDRYRHHRDRRPRRHPAERPRRQQGGRDRRALVGAPVRDQAGGPLTATASAWHAEHAWLPEGLRQKVLIEAEGDRLVTIRAGSEPPAGARRLPGLVLPG